MRVVVEELGKTERDTADMVRRDAWSPPEEDMLKIEMAIEGKVECHGARAGVMMGARSRGCWSRGYSSDCFVNDGVHVTALAAVSDVQSPFVARIWTFL